MKKKNQLISLTRGRLTHDSCNYKLTTTTTTQTPFASIEYNINITKFEEKRSYYLFSRRILTTTFILFSNDNNKNCN